MGSTYDVIKSLLPQFLLDEARFARSRWEDRAAAAVFIGQIKTAFPNLNRKHVKLIKSGFDHTELIVDHRMIFRFPRTDKYRAKLLAEKRLLEELKGNVSVEVPEYIWVEPSGIFGCYNRIEGEELRPEVFWDLSRASQERLLLKVVGFLNVLHSLPMSLIHEADHKISDCLDEKRFSHSDFEGRQPIFAAAIEPKLLNALERFFSEYGRPLLARKRVVHADLVSNHVLLSLRASVGVIDFSEFTAGDPAWDFAVLGSYADWAGPFLLENYAFATEDHGLLARCRQQAVRFWTERLFFILGGQYPSDCLATVKTMLQKALVSAGV